MTTTDRFIGGNLRTVQLRGEQRDVVVDVDGGYEPDTNAHVIEWHFADMSPEEREALLLTEDEEQSIFEQLASASEERDDDD